MVGEYLHDEITVHKFHHHPNETVDLAVVETDFNIYQEIPNNADACLTSHFRTHSAASMRGYTLVTRFVHFAEINQEESTLMRLRNQRGCLRCRSGYLR